MSDCYLDQREDLIVERLYLYLYLYLYVCVRLRSMSDFFFLIHVPGTNSGEEEEEEEELPFPCIYLYHHTKHTYPRKEHFLCKKEQQKSNLKPCIYQRIHALPE